LGASRRGQDSDVNPPTLTTVLNLSAAAAGACCWLVLWGASAREAARRRARARLGAFTDESTDILQADQSQPRRSLILAMAAGLGIVTRLLPEAWRLALRRQALRAGQPADMAEAFVGLRLLCVGAGFVLWAAVASAASDPSNPYSRLIGGFGLMVVALAASATDISLVSRAGARRQAAEAQLPTVLDLLSLSMAAGMGFELSLESMLRRMRGPLSDELRLCLRDIHQLGLSLPAALRAMSERLGDPHDIHEFVEAVAHAHLLGTGLVAALATQTGLLRQERRRRAAAAAQRAPIRMLIPMTLFMLPVLMLIVLAPVLLRLISSLSSIPGA
jgi:tight adherence protein C